MISATVHEYFVPKQKWNIIRTILLQNVVQTFVDYEADKYWYHDFTDMELKQNKQLVASDR